MTYEQGTVVLVPFPFTDLTATKQRPALVLRSDRAEPDLIISAITSQVSAGPGGSEFMIPASELALWGLPKPSKVKLAKVFSLHPSLVRRKLGNSPAPTLERILAKVRVLFEVE